jgi:hypothetical protein
LWLLWQGEVAGGFEMSSNTAPYATLSDLPKFEKRTADVRAPWFKEPAAVKNVRGQDPMPYVTCNSKNAPYATFHNVPKPDEVTVLVDVVSHSIHECLCLY